ncbi:MAG: GDSL-type esterase/lipase family protein [Bacteroidota bacterium]
MDSKNMRRNWSRYIFLFLFSACAQAQVKEDQPQVVDFNVDEELKKYPFIKADSGKLHNDSIALAPFYTKLYQLRQGGGGKVSVVHIGDSHIQADFFSGVVRQHLHLDFGNAGRGFIFPYRLAGKSNEPFDYRTASEATWEYKRNVFSDKPMPIGVGGYTIRTQDTSAAITVTLKKDKSAVDYGTTRLTLFHEKNDDNFDFAVFDTTGTEIGYINITSKSESRFTSTLIFPKPYSKFIIRVSSRDTVQKSAMIYGLLLENEQSGLLYNTIGVNGADFIHYNLSEHFIEQMAVLRPDLLIISLGTNQAFAGKSFEPEKYYAQIDTLVQSILRNNPGVCVLFTTPGDSFRRSGKKRVKNPVVKEVRDVIIKYAREHNMAWWDLYEVSGGYGAMADWYSAGMADKFRLHFSKKGYEIQGELFYRALRQGYETYIGKGK